MKKRAFLFILLAGFLFPGMICAQPILSVSPLQLDKGCEETTDTIFITNQGSGVLSWSASVAIADTTWLSIVGGNSGTGNGFILVHAKANYGPLRIGSISIVSPGAIGSPMLVEVTQHNCTYPNWQYTITGNNHTILLQSTAQLSIENIPLASGDYVGVFWEDTLGNHSCAGYTEYTGISSIVIAWEDDGLTSVKDGFLPGDIFIWKLWRASDGVEFLAQASYMPVSPPITGQEIYQSGGMSGLLELSTDLSLVQAIILPSGWSIFSTYIDPPDPDLNVVLLDFSSNIIIAKNGGGMVYWPAFGLNMIGDLTIGNGYQIKTILSDTLLIEGTQIIPELTGIIIPAGWNIIAYLRTSPGWAPTMIASISTNTVLMKNSNGQVYWLAYSLNTIGDMMPGEGYQIKMNVQDTLYYPPN
ncbi:MAG: hypothetical protein K9H64_06325 [Bacteroidales bacterium]|nr:hypothetical protein [Bacteroidales bacterium]MCF8455312.1 hypothetical protein [Bacteroidales bacterium]